MLAVNNTLTDARKGALIRANLPSDNLFSLRKSCHDIRQSIAAGMMIIRDKKTVIERLKMGIRE
jgi:hypothetical protein